MQSDSYLRDSSAILFASARALDMWSQMWSEPMRPSMPACTRLSRTLGRTPESTTWMPSFCDERMSISRLCRAVASMKATFRILSTRTTGLLPIVDRIISSNLVAMPKKNGPSIS